MKDCKECRGKGAYMGADFDGTGAWAVAKPCPCLTDRLAKLERLLNNLVEAYPKAAGGRTLPMSLVEPYDEALAALEEPK